MQAPHFSCSPARLARPLACLLPSGRSGNLRPPDGPCPKKHGARSVCGIAYRSGQKLELSRVAPTNRTRGGDFSNSVEVRDPSHQISQTRPVLIITGRTIEISQTRSQGAYFAPGVVRIRSAAGVCPRLCCKED